MPAPHDHYLAAEENLKRGGDVQAAFVHAILAQTPEPVIARANAAKALRDTDSAAKGNHSSHHSHAADRTDNVP